MIFFMKQRTTLFGIKYFQGDSLILMGSNLIFFKLNHRCILLDQIVPVPAEIEISFFLVAGTVALGVFWI